MKEVLEELPELRVEDGVDDGVESAVDVAEPRHHAHEGRRDVAVLAASSHGVEYKEGGPAEQEGSCGRRRRRVCLIRKKHQTKTTTNNQKQHRGTLDSWRHKRRIRTSKPTGKHTLVD